MHESERHGQDDTQEKNNDTTKLVDDEVSQSEN